MALFYPMPRRAAYPKFWDSPRYVGTVTLAERLTEYIVREHSYDVPKSW